MTENKWREYLKETSRLISSQAFSLKITNLLLELQYGLMVINFDRAHVHTHTHIHTHTHKHTHTYIYNMYFFQFHFQFLLFRNNQLKFPKVSGGSSYVKFKR